MTSAAQPAHRPLQRAVQFEFRVDAARRAVMEVIDDLQTDDQMTDRVHAKHHQRARHRRDVAAECHVHCRVREPQHLLREREVRQHHLHEASEVEVVVVHRRHGGAQRLRQHRKIAALAHSRPEPVEHCRL
jgi:hypothetical protein